MQEVERLKVLSCLMLSSFRPLLFKESCGATEVLKSPPVIQLHVNGGEG